MQFRDLKKQYQVLKEKIDPAITEVTTNCNFIMGSQVEELEEMLANYVGVKHCITCGNGTDALNLAMLVWKIGVNDAVFVPDFTFFSSGEIVSLVGATPIFVDVDEDTFNINPELLEQQILKVKEEGSLVPKAIVAVDLFGLPADYKAIKAIADKYGLFLLEDGAQGFGGEINNKRACSFGDISTTSFFPAKPVGCYGDGGAVFTDNDEWADLLKSYRVHGKGNNKYDNIRIGLNSRLDTVQAAILKIKLEAFSDYELDDINEIASLYNNMLSSFIKIPQIPKTHLSSWAQYTIQLKDKETRDGLQLYLKNQEIPSMVYYQKPMHEQKAFLDSRINNIDNGDYKITKKLCDSVLSLPMHPYLNKSDIQLVTKAIKTYLK